MKKILLFLIFVAFNLVSNSQEVSFEDKKTVAINFYNFTFDANTTENDISYHKDSYFQNTNTYTTFVFKKNGWVIVSTDKRANPILAFSKEQPFENTTSIANIFLDNYNSYIHNIKQYQEIPLEDSNANEEWDKLIKNDISKEKEVMVAPLLQTIWWDKESNFGDDIAAYNYYAPLVPINNVFVKAKAGSIAVAMGQIMKYWEYPCCEIFDWSNMPETLNTNAPNYTSQKKEIANLFRNIGNSVNMNWDYYDYPQAEVEAGLNAFQNDFNYPNVTMFNENQFSISEWENILVFELDAGRPVLYAGYYGKINRAFVCDGYKQNFFGTWFSYNFGENYDYDTYYQVNPSVWTKYNEIITNIYPANYCNSITVLQSYKNIPAWQHLYYHPTGLNIYSTSAETPIHITSNETVHYKAYNQIVLENFETEDGAVFTAEIIPNPLTCNFINYKNYPDPPFKINTYNKNKSSVLNSFDKTTSKTSYDITIFPNPTIDILKINFNFTYTQTKISLLDYNGKLLNNFQCFDDNFQIDISEFPAGIYIIQIQTIDNIYTEKIIKL
ncbi:MAG: C10 family peptidase [Bacteroidales bacterium]|nr:C10 family peptidase [Bacteroidales bacterium]